MSRKNFNICNRIIRKPYYYIPPCPRCGSRMTGRYVVGNNTYDYEWMINESLRNGELISITDFEPENNAYCADCDYEWESPVQLKMLSIEQINEEKRERHTGEILRVRYEEIKEENKNKGMIARVIGRI